MKKDSLRDHSLTKPPHFFRLSSLYCNKTAMISTFATLWHPFLRRRCLWIVPNSSSSSSSRFFLQILIGTGLYFRRIGQESWYRLVQTIHTVSHTTIDISFSSKFFTESSNKHLSLLKHALNQLSQTSAVVHLDNMMRMSQNFMESFIPK